MSQGDQCGSFLSWWEDRCLRLGFNDAGNGYFVDQKWTNFVPCYFDKVGIVKHPGCNVAYWNLHERRVTAKASEWIVEPDSPLIFFHFSGIGIDDEEGVSKHTTRSNLLNRPDLTELFGAYRQALRLAQGGSDPEKQKYSWGQFSNGMLVNKLCRVVYSLTHHRFPADDPFNAGSEFYAYANKSGLLSSQESASSHIKANTNFADRRLKLLHSVFRMVLKVLGADRYTLFCKYLSYISILRNQEPIFDDRFTHIAKKSDGPEDLDLSPQMGRGNI
jgi:hypothetical protein